MKQIIAKNRAEAKKFCEGGSIQSQRAAYWKQGSIAYRFERLPGETSPTWREDVGGYWWDAKTTIAQKLGIIKCTCQRCGAVWAPRKENPIQCPRCKRVDWNTKKEKIS
jgi:rubrerythrin